MNRFAFLLFLLLLMPLTIAVAQPPGSDAPGIWEQRVATIGEIHRNYYLYLPEDYELYPDRPLIVNLHGSIDTTTLDSAGQRPEVFMFGRQFSPTYLDTSHASMMWKVAEAHKVLVACPLSKSAPAWSPDDPTSNLSYINAMLDDLEASYGDYIDSDRIYASGFSGGGGQIQRLAYRGGDRIAAFAPLFYPMNTELYTFDPPDIGPLGILFVANRYDPTVDVPFTEPSDSITVLQTVQKWNEWLDMTYHGGFFHPAPVDTVVQLKFYNMPGGGDGYHFMHFYTLFVTIPQFQHSYPKYDITGFQANAEVWDFCRRFSLPPAQSREAALDAQRVITPAPMQVMGMNAYPNPFNAATTLSFTLQQPSEVTVSVYDLLGREVMQLAKGERFVAGTHSISVNMASLSTGTYFVQTDVNGQTNTQKLVLVK